jgi:hypothetical protein
MSGITRGSLISAKTEAAFAAGSVIILQFHDQRVNCGAPILQTFAAPSHLRVFIIKALSADQSPGI